MFFYLEVLRSLINMITTSNVQNQLKGCCLSLNLNNTTSDGQGWPKN